MGTTRRFAAAVAVCALVAIAVPWVAAADCCICSGCEAGEAPVCFSFDGCVISDCLARCDIMNCQGAVFQDLQCAASGDCAAAVGAPATGTAMLLTSVLVLMTLSAFALRRRSLPMSLRAASLVALLAGTAVAVDTIAELRLQGSWSDGAAHLPGTKPREQWKANLTVSGDGALSGTVELTGFGDVNVANVEGILRDGVTSGTLRAPDGTAIAQFEGTADAHSAQGTFTRTSGETGSFSWSSDSTQ